jgi:cation diffusion facilitator family transporter
MNNHSLLEGELVAKKTIYHLLILGFIKAAAGLVTGMSVIIADAISTFADMLGVFASYFGLRLSRKTADEKFKYGYYKIETFAALLVSLGTLYAGLSILKNTISNFGVSVEGQFRPFAVTSTIIAIILSMRLAKKLKSAGEKINSLSLIANATDKKTDVFAGLIILVSIFANYKQIPYVESIVTIIISLVIIRVGVLSSKESLFFLLDYWDNPILTHKIKKIFKQEKDLITKVHKIRLRRAGTFIFGEAFVEVNQYAGMEDLREELKILQEKILELDPYLKDFPIYTHISKADKVKVAFPIKSGRSLSASVAPNLRQTTAYLFAEIKNGKTRSFKIKKLNEKNKEPVNFANFLKNEKVDIIINNKLNSLVYYNLRKTHHILIYPNFPNVKNVKQALSLLMLDT